MNHFPRTIQVRVKHAQKGVSRTVASTFSTSVDSAVDNPPPGAFWSVNRCLHDTNCVLEQGPVQAPHVDNSVCFPILRPPPGERRT